MEGAHSGQVSHDCCVETVAGCDDVYSCCRLLCLVELPTLDGVLAHDAVDGKHIVHNVTLVSRLFTSKARLQPSSGKCQRHTLLPPRIAASLPCCWVSPAESVADVPQWVVLAMKCLSKCEQHA